ncbi:MAG: LruC domain-containing protein [Bacteroidales bacterium]|nr:LruC domain-containing protein [Bacteroidales bacterium]
MKTLKIIISLLIIIIIFGSCRKDPVITDKKMKDLEVPQNFDWSSLSINQLTVNIIGSGNGQTLSLYDLDGNKIDSKTIENNKVEFAFRLPYETDTLRLYSPITFMSEYILADQGSIDFTINDGLKSEVLKSTDYALDFDGKSNYVKIENDNNGGIIKGFPFTFSVWVKTPKPGSSVEDMALVNIADPNYASKYYGLCIRKYKDKYKPVIVARNGGSERVKSFNQNLADDTWHQITGVFASYNCREIYVDGVYTGKSSSKIDWNPAAIITSIGRWGDKTPNAYYKGLLDNVCIWNKRLDKSEVIKYYKNIPDGSEEKLVGLWKFNEGSGTKVVNSATSGDYTGENTGAEYFKTSDPEDSDGDGVIDESDDFPDDPDKAYLIVYPSGSKYYFHLYEDLWPGMGDYDFNDVVLKTKLHAYKNSSNKLVGGKMISNVYWIGGGIPRGVGMEWMRPSSGYSKLEYMPTETVSFIEMQNVETDTEVTNAVKLFDGNIVESLGETVDFEYSWDYSLGGNSLWVQVYIYMNRNHEVHMYGQPPTTAADMSLFGTQHDASLTSWDWKVGNTFSMISNFYKTATNLPWGLEIETVDFRVPNEKTEILDAYPQFQEWAESGGTVNRSWYKYPDESRTFLPGNK